MKLVDFGCNQLPIEITRGLKPIFFTSALSTTDHKCQPICFIFDMVVENDRMETPIDFGRHIVCDYQTAKVKINFKAILVSHE